MCKLFSRAPSPRSTNDERGQIISGIVGDSDLPAEMKRLVSISLAQWSLRMRLISHAGAVEPPGLGLTPVYCVLPNWAPDGISGPQQNARGPLKSRGFSSTFGSRCCSSVQAGEQKEGWKLLSQLANINQYPRCSKLVKGRSKTALGGCTIACENVRQDRGQTHSYSGTLIQNQGFWPPPTGRTETAQSQ